MMLYHDLESELAARLEQLERGEPVEVSRAPVTAEVIDLLNLAYEIRTLPPVEPDDRWLACSKGRLMARFVAFQEQDPRRSSDEPGR